MLTIDGSLAARAHVGGTAPEQVLMAIARARRASLDLAQAVYREDGRLMASANVQVACLDATTMRPCAMPRPLRSELERDT